VFGIIVFQSIISWDKLHTFAGPNAAWAAGL